MPWAYLPNCEVLEGIDSMWRYALARVALLDGVESPIAFHFESLFQLKYSTFFEKIFSLFEMQTFILGRSYSRFSEKSAFVFSNLDASDGLNPNHKKCKILYKPHLKLFGAPADSNHL